MYALCGKIRSMAHEHIVVLYHGKCPDGFGGAYAAWKKFGDTAEYIPVKHGEPPPQKLEGREVYLIDFSYDREEEMGEIARAASRFIVLDHHLSTKKIVENIPEHVFDENRSGATIAWGYFHPNVPVPRLLSYLEDDDLFRYRLPETRDVFSYILVHPYHFQEWDALVQTLEDEKKREAFLEKARIYSEYFLLLGDSAVAGAKLVRFEGYECYFANAHPFITMKSYVGHELTKKKPPFALVVSAHPDGFGVSIRGDGTVDVSAIAAKYGGGGHPNSAGFFIPIKAEIPWTEIRS